MILQLVNVDNSADWMYVLTCVEQKKLRALDKAIMFEKLTREG